MAVLFAGASPAGAVQTASWGWATDTFTMSFFGGIPYRGCERAELQVPNAGSTGDIDAETETSIVVGAGATCSNSSIPSSLNAYTIRTRTIVLRNGYAVSGCSTSTTYNTNGEGSIAAAVGPNCDKTSSADATWTVRGTYGWWDYDDAQWRSESVNKPTIED